MAHHELFWYPLTIMVDNRSDRVSEAARHAKRTKENLLVRNSINLRSEKKIENQSFTKLMTLLTSL